MSGDPHTPARKTSAAEPGPRPAALPSVVRALADVSSVGGYFALETGPAGPGWRPLTDLLTGAGPLAGEISLVAERLGTSERRIAASLLFQSLAARLWSPAVGAAVAHGLLLDLAPARLLWRPVPTGPFPLRVIRPAARRIAPADAAGPLHREVVAGLLEPLARAVRETVKIAPGLLWGNAASALAGTAGVLAGARPDLAADAVALARELLTSGVLNGTGELTGPAPGRPLFVRRSCCLYYRLPGGGMCGDCSLARPRPARSPHGAG